LAIIVAMSSVVLRSFGADGTWSSTPDTADWENDGGNKNWSNLNKNIFPGTTTAGSTTNTDTATFNSTSTKTGVTLTTKSGSFDLNIKNITFDASAVSYTIGATNGKSLLLTSAGTVQITSALSGTNITETINAPIVLEPATSTTAGAYTFQNDATSSTNALNFGGGITGGTTSFGNSTTPGITLTLAGSNTGANTISGVISNGNATNGVAVTKSGAGTWVLTGTNTYTGATTISANGGKLQIDNNGGTTAGKLANTVGITINSSGTLLLSGSSSVTDRINNAATVTLNGARLTPAA
jgi:autotransporter-associated beta strand protein